VNKSVLIVEDSDEDMEAINRALSRSFPEIMVHRLPDGDGVIAWLTQHAAPELPSLVLLDLNLLTGDGREVLAAIRQERALQELPVVVLTSSTNPRDVNECYSAGASSYLFKSVDFSLLQTTLSAGLEYWLNAPPQAAEFVTA
jgi:CheY-like chemotaxis protein